MDQATAPSSVPPPLPSPLSASAADSGWRCYREAARSAAFLPPRWSGLPASPTWVAALLLVGLLATLLLERLYVAGPARLDPRALTGGWLTVVLLAWACHAARPVPPQDGNAADRPTATQLFCLILAQTQLLGLGFGLLTALMTRRGFDTAQAVGPWAPWAWWLAPGIWMVLAQWVLLWRAAQPRRLAWLAAATASAGAALLLYIAPADPPWLSDEPEAARPAPLVLTQELTETQPRLLERRLQGLRPQRPGMVDLYGIGFAPYSEEDVFRRESEMVMGVMAERFDAAGRVLQLVNHTQTLEQWPWATPLNLQRAIRRAAALMDRDEDLLFLHLTSHGARDGQLAASFWPLSVDPVQPAQLKAWLDEAGVRFRVISISACYSGSWIAPLAGPDTLVMTAADAEHTSYGCGRLSELTFFGRAMYDEQLRSRTLSFEAAHARSRIVIKQREEEAGKSDGYSNPQIRVGAGIRPLLQRLERQLQQPATGKR
ncbi:C13 family peptidase [Aquabacterium sp. A7-Y]|uniref:C13 family peptidase n=1 Tax=Aquabacterium sp. A7-Y TaxID=1349605 RepID=UPI00223D0663|nr:C13 family peptidase [Aquabacterium sp. A7-Y]MCW7540844.1 C13 family peptidase [Aquabacterium sp. A7-Y]